jgi:hypothetical protein
MLSQHRLRVLALLAILIATGLVCVWMMGVGPVFVNAQAPERTPILCLYDDGTWDNCPMAAPPVHTSIPTATATSTPPVEEPTVEPGGTPEPTEPGPTEVPLFTCQLRALSAINIRSGHGTQYPVLGTWTTDDLYPREFVEFYDGDRDYLWGKGVDGGWTVVYDKPAAAWWAAGTVASWSKCLDVEGWPSGLEPPLPFAQEIIDGPHINMGEGGAEPVAYASKISAAKCIEPALDMCRYIKMANPDAWIVARLITDSIALDLDYDVDAVWNAVQAAIPAGFDAFELENEVVPRTEDQWRRWSQFSIEFAQRLADEKGMQYLAFSFGPGWPPLNDYIYLVDYLRWVAENPLPDGRYHGVASHASLYAPWSRSDMPWVNDKYIAGRVYLANIIFKAKYDLDLEEWPGVWAITEIGLGDGYSGDWSSVYTCTEAASAYRESLHIYKENGYPHVLLWWNFGDVGGGWTSDHACAEAIWG